MRATTAAGLLVVAAVLFLGGVPSGAGATPVCEAPTWDFRVEGNVTVDVEWCAGAHFENRSVVTHEHAEERTVQVNRSATTAFNNRILLQDLSHMLGYDHGDGGIADPSFEDATTCGHEAHGELLRGLRLPRLGPRGRPVRDRGVERRAD